MRVARTRALLLAACVSIALLLLCYSYLGQRVPTAAPVPLALPEHPEQSLEQQPLEDKERISHAALLRRILALGQDVERLERALGEVRGPPTGASLAAQAMPSGAGGPSGDHAPAAAPGAAATPSSVHPPPTDLPASSSATQPLADTPTDVGRWYRSCLEAEGLDPSWSWGQERAVRDALMALGSPDASSVSVDCRTTLCAVDLSFDDVERRDSFFRQLAASNAGPFAQAFYFVTDGPDDTSVDVYVAREGRGLPDMPMRSPPGATATSGGLP